MLVPLGIIAVLLLVHYSNHPVAVSGPVPELGRAGQGPYRAYAANVPQRQSTQQVEAAWVKPAKEILPPVGFDIAAHSIEGFFA